MSIVRPLPGLSWNGGSPDTFQDTYSWGISAVWLGVRQVIARRFPMGQIRSVCHQLSNQPWVSAHSHPRVPTARREHDIAVAVKPPKSFLRQPSRRCSNCISPKMFYTLELFLKKIKLHVFTYWFLSEENKHGEQTHFIQLHLHFYFMQGYQIRGLWMLWHTVKSWDGDERKPPDQTLFYSENPRRVCGLASSLT